MFSSTVAAADTFTPAKVYHPQSSISFCSPHPISISLSQRSMFSNFAGSIKYSRRFPHHRRGVFFTRNSSSPSSSQSETVSNSTPNDDFISRVLKENPSQVEPKYLVGNKLYTLRERENLEKRSDTGGGIIELMKWLNLNLNAILKKKGNEGQDGSSMKSDNVYLKDILREYKGKLYVPEQLFGSNLSEEAEFDSNIETLPRMMYEDFEKYLETGSIKMLTYKEDDGGGYGFRDFVVELKEIPGEKRLQKTKWVMTLPESEAQAVLEEYTGSRYEIEKQRTALVGKLPDYPHPVASSISSRMMVELGVLTAAMAAAAVFVGGFLASAVFAVTSFVFALAVFVIWPMTKPFLKLFISLFSGVVERISENFADIVIDGWISSKVNLFYNLGGGAATLEALAPIMVVVLTMVFLLRFTLSRRPKNYRKWDIWQGIEFSQSKAEARVDGSTGVTFKDVAGIEEAVEELQELVKYLKNPELFDKLGIKPPHGVLLEGPPGCGKTLVAKAIAGEAGVPFYEMAGSEFAEVLVGVGSARVRDLFKRAKVNRPSVIFVDEIDALAARRLGLYGKPTSPFDDKNDAIQERETTLNQLLIELDGFDTGKGVIFLGATNRKDLLDPALLRPGRFDRKIRIQPPNAKGRIEILNVHARGVRLSDTVDLSSYGRNLRGWTGAKLAQLLREAALVAVRKNHESILPSDMNEAVDRLTIGPKSLGIKLGYQGQCRRATTEVGIAITSHLLRRYENAKVESCDRISITPRGQTFSQIVFHRLDDESYKFERRPQLLHRLQVFLGGRAAEEVIYGRDTSRASVKYLADASWMARKIITIWNLEGMTIHGEPPPWRRRAKFIGPRLDFEGSLYRHYRLIARPVNFNLDDEVARRADELICELYEKTVALLRRHHAALLKSVKVLLKQKEIRGEEIEFILQNYPPHTPTSFILGERDPGSLPFFEEQGRDMEYNLLATSSSAQTL